MKRIALCAVALLAFSAPRWATGQPDRPQPYRAPNVSGTWYMSGDPDRPCEIIQRRPDGRAVFVNEKGEQARGWVARDHVEIPAWAGPDGGPLRGKIQPNAIAWSNGTFWTR